MRTWTNNILDKDKFRLFVQYHGKTTSELAQKLHWINAPCHIVMTEGIEDHAPLLETCCALYDEKQCRVLNHLQSVLCQCDNATSASLRLRSQAKSEFLHEETYQKVYPQSTERMNIDKSLYIIFWCSVCLTGYDILVTVQPSGWSLMQTIYVYDCLYITNGYISLYYHCIWHTDDDLWWSKMFIEILIAGTILNTICLFVSQFNSELIKASPH